MGCDIHLFTERRSNIDGVEKWSNCDNWKLNRYYDPSEDDGEREYSVNSVYNDRNYHLFSVLANVRNYSDNKSMGDPKGLPSDVSECVKRESDSWGIDGHSHSYFTLSELKAFKNANNIQKYSGLMTPEDAARVDAGEMPFSWCQGTTIKTYVHREWEREGSPLDNLIEKLDARMREEFWVWDSDELPELEEKFRIVFWFDN